jgi:hypothetical protein
MDTNHPDQATGVIMGKNASKAAVLVVDFKTEKVTTQFFTGPGCAQKAEEQAKQLRAIDGGPDNARVLVQANDEAVDSFNKARETAEAKTAKPAGKKSKAAVAEEEEE